MSTPKEKIDALSGKLQANPDVGKNINAIYQFEITGENAAEYWVDLTQSPGTIGEGKNENAACTITTDSADFVAMMDKTANPMQLYMSQKLKVAGNLALSLKLQEILKL